MDREQSAEKRDALKRGKEFIAYHAWLESMQLEDGSVIDRTVSGYGVSIEEAQANAQNRFQKMFGKGIGFWGGSYEILHGSKWH